jgi:hypothetical protein
MHGLPAKTGYDLGMTPVYRLEDTWLRARAGYALRGIVGVFGQVYRLEKL